MPRQAPVGLIYHVLNRGVACLPLLNDEHFLTVCRYLERNSLRAALVKRATVRLAWPAVGHRRLGPADGGEPEPGKQPPPACAAGEEEDG